MDPQIPWSQRELGARMLRESRQRRLIRQTIAAGAAVVLLLIVGAVIVDKRGARQTTVPTPAASAQGTGQVSPYQWTQLRPTGPIPAPRYGHDAVWTGRDLLVYGGYKPDGSCCRDDLSAYDPKANRWRTLSAGPARAGGGLVWDGKGLLLYGGTSPVTDSRVWRYDPGLNQWTPVITSGSPPLPQSVGSAVWDGQRMIVFGDAGTDLTGTVWTYQPAIRTWSGVVANGPLPPSYKDTAAVWDGQEALLPTQSGGVYSYTPTGNQWAALTPANLLQLHGNAVAWDGTDLLSAGGMDPSGALLSSVSSLGPDPSAVWSWSPAVVAGGAFPPRSAAAGVWDGRRALFFGGQTGTTSASSGLWSLAVRLPLLTVSIKNDHPGRVKPLDTLGYTIVVRNSGSVPATQIRIQATLPPDGGYITGTTTLRGANVPDATSSDSALSGGIALGDLPVGGTVSLTLGVQVLSSSLDGDSFPLLVTAQAAQRSDVARGQLTQTVAVAALPTTTSIPLPTLTAPAPTATIAATGTTPPSATAVPPGTTVVPSQTPAPPTATVTPIPSGTPSREALAQQLVQQAASGLASAVQALPPPTAAPTVTASGTASPTLVPTQTPVPTAAFTRTPIPTRTPRPTRTPTPTRTPRPTPTVTLTATLVPTHTATATTVPTRTPVPTFTPVPTMAQPSPTSIPTNTPLAAATSPAPTATTEPTLPPSPTAPPTAVPPPTRTQIPG